MDLLFWTAATAVAQAVAALAAGVGLVVAALAIRASSRESKEQNRTSRELHERQVALSEAIHHQQILLSQRQLLLPLWDHLESIKDIKPDDPVGPDMVRMANKLELVALCWEGELIDILLIKRTFHDKYIYFYERLSGCMSPPKGYKTGPEYLQENPAANRLYTELKREAVNRGVVPPLKGR